MSTSGYQRFTSDLPSAAERFLAKVVVHSIKDGWRTPADFLRHFPPAALMSALEIARDLRAQILVGTAGVHEKLARKKSTSAATEDLQIALDEGVTEAAAVLDLFPPDERVRYLDATLLWKFAVEEDFWNVTEADFVRHRRAAARLTYILEEAVEERLLNLHDVIEGITFDEIAERLPEPEVRKLVKHALQGGRSNIPFTEESLLELVPLAELVEFIPLDHTWQKVVIAKVAGPAGFVTDQSSSDRAPAARASELAARSNGAKQSPPPLKPSEKKKSAKPKDSPAPALDVDIDVDDFDKDQGRMALDSMDAIEIQDPDRPVEDEARRRVTQRLIVLDRLPPGGASLSLPILLSIESMYADLLALSSDEERESCIRESFPNESHLRTAMLALIELLDPGVNTKDPVISEADVDSLMKVVLFEERQRYEQARVAGHPHSPMPAPVSMRRTSVPSPPEAIRRSVAPPPLPTSSGDPDDRSAKRAR